MGQYNLRLGYKMLTSTSLSTGTIKFKNPNNFDLITSDTSTRKASAWRQTYRTRHCSGQISQLSIPKYFKLQTTIAKTTIVNEIENMEYLSHNLGKSFDILQSKHNYKEWS